MSTAETTPRSGGFSAKKIAEQPPLVTRWLRGFFVGCKRVLWFVVTVTVFVLHVVAAAITSLTYPALGHLWPGLTDSIEEAVPVARVYHED
jgi:hypothetical protein